MILLDFTAKIIESLAWPATLLAIIVFLRKPIKDLLPFLERLKYKDFELSFRRQLQEALETSDVRQVTEGTDSNFDKLVLTSPRCSVLEAWRELEIAADSKLKELQPTIQQIKLGPDGALGYFEYTGALIPRTKKALSHLRALRNQAAHLPDSALSIEDARGYIQVAETVKKQLQSLTTIPQFKLTRLTLLILEYNHLLDTRKYDHITIHDIHREIKDGSVLRYIAKEAAEDVDLSLYLDSKDSSDFERQYAQQLRSLYDAYAGQERRKWGVENFGLCILVAWTNEIIQTGSGWHPNEDMA
jgi:hypothetical protein